jgi:hypothetical protein
VSERTLRLHCAKLMEVVVDAHLLDESSEEAQTNHSRSLRLHRWNYHLFQTATRQRHLLRSQSALMAEEPAIRSN